MDRVCSKWKEFGTLLGISLNTLSVWERQYRGNANMCWTKVMEHWLNGGCKHSYPPTWEGLYLLLEDVQCSQVAEELKKALDEKMAEDKPVISNDSSMDEAGATPGGKYYYITIANDPIKQDFVSP